jgi:hypothetical protein
MSLVAVLAGTDHAVAQSELSGEQIRIARARAHIAIDGDLSDEGWRGATRIDRWYEVNPGDNTEPKVKNVGYLAYDDRFFYAGFEFADPHPAGIRAPLGDRDNVPSFTDYGGIILDTRHDGRTAEMFLANPRGIQYDAMTDDASGEDSSPDFFWESAARITERGWTLEIRVPFSSLRYRTADPQTWGILLYRNYPRDFRYQFFSARLPRGGNCFICRSNLLVGLEHLPSGGHIVAAPYVTASEGARPRGELGTPLVNEAVKPQAGFDVKYTPNADNAIDFTVKPDFSQVESDTAQISANERFALFFPEKRPFFLEGVNLLSTPIQAVYTRTITAPRWGARATGKAGGVVYTALVADDAGGGSVIVPGPNGSDLAPQDFRSRVFIGRARRDIGRSFVSMLVTDRETDGSGHNRVIGPDVEWRPSSRPGSCPAVDMMLHTMYKYVCDDRRLSPRARDRHPRVRSARPAAPGHRPASRRSGADDRLAVAPVRPGADRAHGPHRRVPSGRARGGRAGDAHRGARSPAGVRLRSLEIRERSRGDSHHSQTPQ